MRKRLLSLALAGGAIIVLGLGSCKPQQKTEILDIFHTTDIHGNFLPHDFIEDQEGTGSLARVASCVRHYRDQGSQVLLLDGGDLLQGQPTAYYYNFVDTTSQHFASEVLNFMGYDAMVIGNHDIETGHGVYDRFVESIDFPMLGANVIDVKASQKAGEEIPYFKPYTIVTKGDKKIAIIGVTTPELTQQLPEVLWSGLQFEDQVSVAKSYIPEVMEENPDLVIALMHSGSGPQDSTRFRPMAANVGYQIAQEIPEIDLVLCGHDHALNLDSIVQPDGKKTYLLDPGPNGDYLSHISIRFDTETGQVAGMSAEMIDMNQYAPDDAFLRQFQEQYETVANFVARKVGHITRELDAKGSFFRPSLFNDLIHTLQFSIFDDADVSITAPLAERTIVAAGDLYVRDLFKLYKYENMVYLMRMTGSELRGHLEESYDRWIHTMSSPDDPMIRISEKKRGGIYLPLEQPSFNFDTAAGIEYTVDVTKPKGQRIQITTVGADRPFNNDSTYRVVMNSYRGNGGGGLLTQGAHLSPEMIKERRERATDKDLRYYLMNYLEQNDPYEPQIISKWKFIPEGWMMVAIPRDSVELFKK